MTTTVDVRDFAQVLLDDQMLSGLTDAFIRNAVDESGVEDETVQKVIDFYSHRSCQVGIEMVQKHAESPLERVFVLALMFGFVKWEPMGLSFTPVFSEDAPTMIDAYRNDHIDALAAIEDYRKETGNTEAFGMVPLILEHIEEEPSMGALLRHVMEEVLHTWDRFHLTLQPRFKNIRVDGRTIRADALVWIPSEPRFKVLLECDGYEFHSDKVRFTADRRRDRVLAGHGYRVMRFSGHEVFENPVASSVEAYDYLRSVKRELGMEA